MRLCGRTKDKARAEAIEWLDGQSAHAGDRVAGSGAVFNPAASVLGYGYQEKQTG